MSIGTSNIPYLYLSASSNNQVLTDCLNGVVSNALQQSNTTNNVVGNVTFASGSSFSGQNATISNLSLLGTNGNSVDNNCLPNTITKNIDTSNVSCNRFNTGTIDQGTRMHKLVTTKISIASNTSETIAVLSSLTNGFLEKWVLDIKLSGSSSGTLMLGSTGEVVFSHFHITKTGQLNQWFSSTFMQYFTNRTRLELPTITINQGAGTIQLNHIGSANVNGSVHWLVDVEWTCLNNTNSAPPTLV
jgi:hypothetical protein